MSSWSDGSMEYHVAQQVQLDFTNNDEFGILTGDYWLAQQYNWFYDGPGIILYDIYKVSANTTKKSINAIGAGLELWWDPYSEYSTESDVKPVVVLEQNISLSKDTNGVWQFGE